MPPATVSVLITTYNSSKVLEPCLDSLRCQDYGSLELIVVDNASSDGTRKILGHLDRGAEELDRGQYDEPAYVFGATGAAALYRRVMIEDISVAGEFYDEDFFSYREDADVAWRAQLRGWRCVYTPRAVAWHVRRVTPSRRRELPLFINWHSVKNRFLM